MPTPKRGPRLGGNAAHQKQLLANLARDLYRHGRITTTEAKAKALRPYAEKLITKAKRGDLAARRQVLAELHDRDVVAFLFEEVAPRFASRDGGYTRILKLGPRKGDNAPMALIELVERGEVSGEDTIEESKAGRSRGLFGRRAKRTGEPATAGTGTALLEDVDEDEAEFDVEDDEQVAAAIAEATASGDDEGSGVAAQAAPGPEKAPPVPEDTMESNPAETEGPAGPAASGKDADTGKA